MVESRKDGTATGLDAYFQRSWNWSVRIASFIWTPCAVLLHPAHFIACPHTLSTVKPYVNMKL